MGRRGKTRGEEQGLCVQRKHSSCTEHSSVHISISEPEIANPDKYERWRKTNVIQQKQEGFFGVYVKLPLGNMSTNRSRAFADVVDQHASDELRITVNQGYLIRFVRPNALKHLYVALDKLALAEPRLRQRCRHHRMPWNRILCAGDL